MLSRGPVCVKDALSYENFKTFLLCTQFSTFKNLSRSPFDTTLVFNKTYSRQMQFLKKLFKCLTKQISHSWLFFAFISSCKSQDKGLITCNEMNFLKKKVQKAFESLTSDDGPDDSSNSSGEGDEVIIHYFGCI